MSALDIWVDTPEQSLHRHLDAVCAVLRIRLGARFTELPLDEQRKLAAEVLDAADTGI